MNKRQVILIRHGQSKLNKLKVFAGRQDTPLTEEGINQIKRTSDFILKRYSNVDVIFTSPLTRAKKTAEIINQKINTRLIIEKRIIETDFGIWEGKSPLELSNQSEWKEYESNPFYFKFPGGESPQDVKKRLLEFKQEVLNMDNWERIIIVSHYTPIVFYIMDVIGCNDNFKAAFKITHGAVSVIEYREKFEYIGMLNFLP